MKRNLLFLSSALFFDSYECTSRKFLVVPSKQYLRDRKNRNEKHVAMRGTRQAVHKKFEYSSLYVLNWQIRKSIQQNALRGTTR